MADEPTIVPVLPSMHGWPLHGVDASRRIEQAATAAAAPHALMQRAGLASAKLLLALAPHARRVWVAAGPGNNGGDGLVAARHLHLAGLRVRVSLLGDAAALPADASDAFESARAAGVPIDVGLPAELHCDAALDALLGIGASRAPQGAIAQAIRLLGATSARVLAVDVPSGLAADDGRVLGDAAVTADDTLSLLTLKPGLFTAHGRDHAGRVWFDALGADAVHEPASACLIAPPLPTPRAHAQHKGSFGDVIVVGGAPGMSGAALLAARAALTAGAGRVYVARLDGCIDPDPWRPELMPRRAPEVLQPAPLGQATVVCGCGGGDAIRPLLPPLLHHARRLVIDADALNAIAAEEALRAALRARRGRGLATIVTPHPLEAARLLGITAADVQAGRLARAEALAADLQCTAVLKGSGTVVATPGATTAVNPTGNARLGSAGSGDVLAGWIGGTWSQRAKDAPHRVAADVVWLHGRAAEAGDLAQPLRAGDLVDAMARATPR